LTYRNSLELGITVKTRVRVSNVNNFHGCDTTLSAYSTDISTSETEFRTGNAFVLYVCKTYGACYSVRALSSRCQNLACVAGALSCTLESKCWLASSTSYITSSTVL